MTTSPSRQLVGRTFSDGSATRTLQPPESPCLGRRGLDSMRELPPLSPSLSRRALSPMPSRNTPDPKLTREVAESPRPRRWAAHGASPEDFSLTLGARSRRTRSPSPTLGESLAPSKGSFSGRLSPAYSLGSLTGASPRQSPRAQRKLSSGDLRVPVTRERKNSITEISDNEDDLLEYHRRQRQERLREQEMERLVSRCRGICGHPGQGLCQGVHRPAGRVGGAYVQGLGFLSFPTTVGTREELFRSF